jgi:hypothetical protein
MQGPVGTAWLAEALCRSKDLLDTVDTTRRVKSAGERDLPLSPLPLLALIFRNITRQGLL